MTRAATPSATPSATLWDELRALLRITLQVFGDPKTLLEDLVLPRAEARRLASWIASLEAAARALLAALAATLPQTAPARRPSARAQAGQAIACPAPTTPATAPEAPPAADAPSSDEAPPEVPDSEAWAGVAFRFAPRVSAGGGPGGASCERRFLAVRGLAYRLEALVRVAAAPEAYARRLARRLAASPGLAARARRRPGRRGHPPPYEELVDDAFALARAAPPGTG